MVLTYFFFAFDQIFTPDDTHYEIALYAVRKGVHVFLTKPPVKTVKEVK